MNFIFTQFYLKILISTFLLHDKVLFLVFIQKHKISQIRIIIIFEYLIKMMIKFRRSAGLHVLLTSCTVGPRMPMKKSYWHSLCVLWSDQKEKFFHGSEHLIFSSGFKKEEIWASWESERERNEDKGHSKRLISALWSYIMFLKSYIKSGRG